MGHAFVQMLLYVKHDNNPIYHTQYLFYSDNFG